MGIFDSFKRAQALSSVANVLPFPASGLESPWADTSDLLPIIAEDLFGKDFKRPMSVAEGLRIPGVVKARGILQALLCRCPLKTYDDTDKELPNQPLWLTRTDTGVSPFMRNCLTLDNLIFREAAVWVVQRGSAGIMDAVHVPYEQWEIDSKGRMVIRGKIAVPGSYIWIPGTGPGLLAMAPETFRGSRDMDRSWIERVKTPIPGVILQESEDSGMTTKEARPYVQAVKAALQQDGGAVMFLPNKINGTFAQALQEPNLFISGRNAIRVDIANFFVMPASHLDGSVSQASLTYSTQEGRMDDLTAYTLPYWAAPIEEALSMAVPRGQHVRFDLNAAAPAPETTATPAPAETTDPESELEEEAS